MRFVRTEGIFRDSLWLYETYVERKKTLGEIMEYICFRPMLTVMKKDSFAEKPRAGNGTNYRRFKNEKILACLESQ